MHSEIVFNIKSHISFLLKMLRGMRSKQRGLYSKIVTLGLDEGLAAEITVLGLSYGQLGVFLATACTRIAI